MNRGGGCTRGSTAEEEESDKANLRPHHSREMVAGAAQPAIRLTSALVSGLNKMDKSSVLEDAIKYLKHLQERVRKLEEKAQRQALESPAVMVKKTQIVLDDEGSSSSSSSDEIISGGDEQPLPEIEARFCDSHVLLRVHCEKHKGILVKLLSKVESLNMAVVNTSATPFGNVVLDIIIIAELEKEFNLMAKEVVADLRAAIVPVTAA